MMSIAILMVMVMIATKLNPSNLGGEKCDLI